MCFYYSAMYWVVTVHLYVWTVFMIGDMNAGDMNADDLVFFMHEGYDKEAKIITMEITYVHHLVAPAFIEVMTARSLTSRPSSAR